MPDQIVSLELTINSVSLRSSGGDISLLSESPRPELSRLKTQPLLLAESIPQGKYGGITIGISNLTVSYIDSAGVLHENVAASLTASSITNPTEFSIGSTPASISLNIGFKVSTSGGNDAIATPMLNFSTEGEPAIKSLAGRIYGVDGSTIWVDVVNAPSFIELLWDEGVYVFSFAIDSSTELQGFNAIKDLTTGTTVDVDAVLSSGGTLQATKVRLEEENPSKLVTEGLALSVAPDQLEVMVREVHGSGDELLPARGKSLTVKADAVTRFDIEHDAVDLNNLEFTPRFDALAIAPGQNVRAAAASGNSMTINADQLRLAKQSLDGIAGTVTPGSVSGQYSFTLTLPTESAFAQLTGHSSVLVTLQPTTEKSLYFGQEECVTCISVGRVRVRGLLFFSAGQYRLVADRLAIL